MGKNIKIVAVMVLCFVVLSAMAEGSKPSEEYTNCFTVCNDKCLQAGKNTGQGSTYCEVNCDEKCSELEHKGKKSPF